MEKADHPIRAFRKREKVSLQELGERVNRSKATLSRIESGKQSVPEDLLKPLADATGIAPADLRPDLADLMGED